MGAQSLCCGFGLVMLPSFFRSESVTSRVCFAVPYRARHMVQPRQGCTNSMLGGRTGPVVRRIVHLGDELLTGLAPIAEDHTKGLLPLFVKAQIATLGAAQCSSIFVHLE